jgi:hypothetical protein
VEILWMNRAYPVDEPTAKIFFATAPLGNAIPHTLWTRFRTSLRLFRRARSVEFPSLTHSSTHVSAAALTHDVHRFEESIGGRHYLIEVTAVAKDRWRAYIVRVPGVPTALMPFYGRTPREAAQQLSAWLTRAYERASTPSRPV